MNPTRVWARNFRTYPSLAWEPQDGLTTILGRNSLGDGADSNGAGKSTLLEALFVALFGPPLPWGEYLTVGGEATACEVGLEFEHGGRSYRVRRQYDAKGRGKTVLDLEREGEPLAMGTQAETQALLTNLIGLSEATFVHSVYAPQGHRRFADPSLPPRERKEILADALGLDVWEKLKTMVSTDIREIEATLAGIAQRLGALEDDLARKPELEAAHGVFVAAAAQAARTLAEAEQAEEKAQIAYQEARSAADKAAVLLARRDTARAQLAQFDEKASAAAEAAERGTVERAEIERLTPLAAEAESLELEVRRVATADLERAALLDKREGLVAQINDRSDRVTALGLEIAEARSEAQAQREQGAAATCPTCEQPLHGEALAKAQASVERAAARLDAKAMLAIEQSGALTREIAELRSTHDAITIPAGIPAETVANLHERLQEAREAAAAVVRHRASVDALATAKFPSPTEHEAAAKALDEAESALAAATVPDADTLTQLARAAEFATASRTVARATDRDAQAELARSEERLRNLATLAERAQEALTERGHLTDRLEVLKALERSYGRDGIPALLLEVHAIPQIEETARTVLEALGMPFRVELATQRENKTGGLRDTLDVVVHEPGGARSYATYSGGERTRLEVALRVGIARLIAQRSSSACALFALDELPWLDRSGQTALVEVLRGLPEFEKIVMVSHDEVLADSFDQAVVVVRDESGSRIEASIDEGSQRDREVAVAGA